MKDRNEIHYRVREERGRVEMVARRQCGLDVQKKREEGRNLQDGAWKMEGEGRHRRIGQIRAQGVGGRTEGRRRREGGGWREGGEWREGWEKSGIAGRGTKGCRKLEIGGQRVEENEGSSRHLNVSRTFAKSPIGSPPRSSNGADRSTPTRRTGSLASTTRWPS